MPVFDHAAFKTNVDLTALKIVELIEKIHEMTPDSDERHSLLNDMVQIKDKIHFVDKLPNPNEAKQITLLTRYYGLYVSMKQSIIQARKTYGNPQIKPLLLEADVLCRKVLVYLQKLLTALGQSFDPIPKMTDATFTRGWMPQRGTRRGLQPPPAYRHQTRTRSRTRSRGRSGTRSRSRSTSRHSTGTRSASPFDSLNGSPDSRMRKTRALRLRRAPYGYERGSDPNMLHQRRELAWATPPERGYSA